MSYLVVYTNQETGTEERQIFNDAGGAAEHIQSKLRSGVVHEDQINLYSLHTVEYRIERVPVVSIAEDVEPQENNSPTYESSPMVPEITTEEELEEEEQALRADHEEERENDSVEVFTFDS